MKVKSRRKARTNVKHCDRTGRERKEKKKKTMMMQKRKKSSRTYFVAVVYVKQFCDKRHEPEHEQQAPRILLAVNLPDHRVGKGAADCLQLRSKMRDERSPLDLKIF